MGGWQTVLDEKGVGYFVPGEETLFEFDISKAGPGTLFSTKIDKSYELYDNKTLIFRLPAIRNSHTIWRSKKCCRTHR